MKRIVAILCVVVSIVAASAGATPTHENVAANKAAICQVFGKHCRAALNVSWCESHWHTWASNGQYLGLFQMGSSERRIYGHSSTAYGQAVAAYRYFKATGYTWRPWSCKPW